MILGLHIFHKNKRKPEVFLFYVGRQRHFPAPAPVQPEHCVSALVFPSVCCFFSSSLLGSHQFSSMAASTSAGSGLPLLSFLVLQCQVDVHLVRCVQFFLTLMFRVRCLGSISGVEVPGRPVLGSLHSPSTWRRVSSEWYPLPGLPWIPPLWLMAFAPH